MLIALRSHCEGGILENEDTDHNELLLDLNSAETAYMDIVEEEDHAESRGSLQGNDTDSQIENAEASSSAEVADVQTDISGVLRDAGNDVEESQGSLHENDTDPQIQESNGESTAESTIGGSKYVEQKFMFT
jgi:hypothetical protein